MISRRTRSRIASWFPAPARMKRFSPDTSLMWRVMDFATAAFGNAGIVEAVLAPALRASDSPANRQRESIILMAAALC